MVSKSIEDFIESVSNYYTSSEYIPVSYEEIEGNIFDKSDCIFTWSPASGKMNFRSGFQTLLGIEDHSMSLERFVSRMHPEEVEYVKRIGQLATVHSIQNSESNKDWTLYVSHRIKRQDDTYTHVLAQSVPHSFDENGLIKEFLVKIRDINFQNLNEFVTYKFIHPGLDTLEFHKEVYADSQKIFSSRELQIIGLIELGKTSNEIAHILEISMHTVATHRKKILKKCNCHSAKELLHYCKKHGILLD